MINSIQHRRSIRKYEDHPVEEEKLQEILEAARLAPSGNNNQPWYFIIIKSEEGREKIAQICHNQTWMLSAPVFIVAVGDASRRIDEPGLIVDENSCQVGLKKIIRDTALAVENLMLEADHQGLGTCWVGYFNQNDLRPALKIPDDKYVLGVIPLGYPAEEPDARSRRPLSEIIKYETW